MEVLNGIFRIGETASGFDDDVRSHARPVDGCGIFFGKHLNTAVADDDTIAVDADGLRQGAEQRVVLGEVGESRGVGEVVDRNKFDVGVVQAGADDVATDATEAVNSYFY